MPAVAVIGREPFSSNSVHDEMNTLRWIPVRLSDSSCMYRAEIHEILIRDKRPELCAESRARDRGPQDPAGPQDHGRRSARGAA